MARSTSPQLLPTEDPINAGWLVFGSLVSESLGPRQSGRAQIDATGALMLPQAGLVHRLFAWWTRPSPASAGSCADSATDAATRLEILARGGLSR